MIEEHQHTGGIRNKLSRRSLLRGASAGLLAALALRLQGPETAQAQGATPAFDPIPDTARGPAIPASGYLVQQIDRGLYHVTDGVYQMMFLTTGKGVIVVDAPPTIGANILRAIRGVTQEPITHVVYSHHHADHIGAASLFPAEAQRIAHQETFKLLRAARDPNRPLPTQTFDQNFQLNVGQQVLHLDYRGPNHSPDNIFIYAPQQAVLMLVDVIFPGWVPFKDLAQSEDLPAWQTAHNLALAYPFQTLIGGHLTRLGTRQDVLTQQEYVGDLRVASAEALVNVDFGAIYQRLGGENPWALFDAYLEAVADRATAATLAKWRGRLGGADVFTHSNALVMAESLRIDDGFLGPFGIRP